MVVGVIVLETDQGPTQAWTDAPLLPSFHLLPTHLSTCLSIYPPARPSTCPPARLSLPPSLVHHRYPCPD